MIQAVESKPDITMPELAARHLEEHGIIAAPATLSRLLCRHGFTYKKHQMASECARVRTSAPFGHWKTHTFMKVFS